jgi:hypothetical protein
MRTHDFTISALTLAFGLLLSEAVVDASDRQGAVRSPQVDRASVLLSVERVRLEAGPEIETGPSTVLKFDLVNTSRQPMTDIVLEVSITAKPRVEPPSTPSRILVRPFRIQGDLVLESGYTVNFDVLLQRFSADCDCVANVSVVSSRSSP